ncbi:EF hand protein (macronuclear) [Tetrahymena thermophila SB210]|uniref:EF hand protein n=1 Tax=Tetrahymena thermophila (strain SB210) TaxID=312017 RepID=I7LXK1_TETTS|nr:EF hand protein [Tetrahymena thermophila SB210]EAS04798.1 EF hand protein [Tetrahymena thermophila SB210]|eukprot:XP_001025043.1 EF hand protein [Tetrahymena thermophila SB210]
MKFRNQSDQTQQISSKSPSKNDQSLVQNASQNDIKEFYSKNDQFNQNKSLLMKKEYQNWLRKRYRVRANINYLWKAEQLYDKKQLEELFDTVIQNSPDIYKFEMNQDSSNNQDQSINLEAFYHVMKKLGKQNFMDRNSFNNILHLIDRDGNRKLNKNEFYTMLMSKTINQQIFKLNQGSWKKQFDCQQNKDNSQKKRTRFVSADSNYQKQFDNEVLPSIKQNKMNIQTKDYQQFNINAQKILSTACTPINNPRNRNKNFKHNQLNNSCLEVNNSHVNNFSQIDMTKMIGNLKYENDRSKLLKNFESVRKEKSIDIEEKCDKLNQILQQKHFNVDHIGISPTSKLLSKQKIQEIRSRKQSLSPSPQTENKLHPQSQIDLFGDQIFISQVNQQIPNQNQKQFKILPSINKDKSNPFTLDNSTNIGSNLDDFTIQNKSNAHIQSLPRTHNRIDMKFHFVKHLSEINFDEQKDSQANSIQQTNNMIYDKQYNNYHQNYIKYKSNTCSVKRNAQKQNSLLSSGQPSYQNLQIHQSMEFIDNDDDNENYHISLISDKQKQDLNQFKLEDQEDDQNFELDDEDEELFQFSKRELGMIVERAKYKGKKQAQVLNIGQDLNHLAQKERSRKETIQSNLKEITNNSIIYNQYPKNIRKTFKQNSFDSIQMPKSTKRSSNSKLQQSRQNSIQRIFQNQQTQFQNESIILVENKPNRDLSTDSSYVFLKLQKKQ